MSPGTSPPIVVVLGMHRSGTSALSGALHACGIRMGTDRWFKPPPSPENPKGFFEDWRLRKANDLLLAAVGYEVKSWATPIPQVVDAARRHRLAMRGLLRWRELEAKGAAWGWKDPRQCLTHGAWAAVAAEQGVGDRLRLLVVTREPGAVAASMVARDNTPDLAHALQVWAGYTAALLDAVAAHDPALVHAVRFEDLLGHDPTARRRLERFLTLPAGSLERAGLEPTLQRSAAPDDLHLPADVADVRDRVERLVDAPGA